MSAPASTTAVPREGGREERREGGGIETTALQQKTYISSIFPSLRPSLPTLRVMIIPGDDIPQRAQHGRQHTMVLLR
jgi:hypothetical protein